MKAFQHFDPEALAGEFQHPEAAKPAKAAKPQGFRQFQPPKAHLKSAKVEGTLGGFSQGLGAGKLQKTSALATLGTLGGVSGENNIVLLQVPEGVPEAWAQGAADLLAMPPHKDWREAEWKTLQNDALAFLREWAAQAYGLGWEALDLFGIHAEVPRARLDGIGLVPLLDGQSVVAVTAERAVIEASRGTLVYRRRQTWPSNCCLIWKLTRR